MQGEFHLQLRQPDTQAVVRAGTEGQMRGVRRAERVGPPVLRVDLGVHIGRHRVRRDNAARRDQHPTDLHVLQRTAQESREHVPVADRDPPQQLVDGRRDLALVPAQLMPGVPTVGEQVDQGVAEHGGRDLVPGHHQQYDQGDDVLLRQLVVLVGGLDQRADQVLAGISTSLRHQLGAEGDEVRQRLLDLLGREGRGGEGMVTPVGQTPVVETVEAHQPAEHRDGQRAGEAADEVHRPVTLDKLVDQIVDHRGNPGAPAGDGARSKGPTHGTAQPLMLNSVQIIQDIWIVQQVRIRGERGCVGGKEMSPVQPRVGEHLAHVRVAPDHPNRLPRTQLGEKGRPQRFTHTLAVHRGQRLAGFAGYDCTVLQRQFSSG